MTIRFSKIAAVAATLAAVAVIAVSPWFRHAPEDPAREMPVLHNGRVKAFDGFARQALQTVAGRQSLKKTGATALVLEILADPEKARKKELIRVDHEQLKKSLELDPSRHYFSLDEIAGVIDRLAAFGRAAEARRDRQESVPLIERKAEQVYGSWVELQHLVTGESLGVTPTVGHSWLTLDQNPALSKTFLAAARAFASGKTEEFAAAAREYTGEAHTLSRGHSRTSVPLEAFYLKLRPFHLAAFAYLAAFGLLLLRRLRPALAAAGASSFAVALVFHTVGLVLRVVILGRPPVSNMYESMIFMNWVLAVAAIGFAFGFRSLTLLTAGSIVSAAVMIYGDLLPVDSSLDVLVPVLRSNYWLTIHVMTIVSSYGLFGLAMGLGHRHLILDTAGKLPKPEESSSLRAMLRIIQTGVILLGIGTVLGGVWANESWGRFWGWDPKETWALITFLGYLVLIHLYQARRVSPFSLAMSTIGGFMLVLMTWYGVNFVLGKGLHSYGQGSGGMLWVLAYLAAEAVFVAFIYARSFGKRA